VYICCPISCGDLCTNINNATAAFHELRRHGFAPFCPAWSCFASECWNDTDENTGIVHVLTEADVGPEDTDGIDWMLVDLPWVLASDAVLRLPGLSRGADIEVLVATAKGIPVFRGVEELKKWAADKGVLPCRA
jgi:hypothetical protein